MKALNHISGIISNREHISPSRINPKKINSQTANAALKRIGYNNKLVAHGLRTIASTALNEKGSNANAIESFLAHVEKNEVRRAYNRATYSKEKEEIIEWWSNFIYSSPA